jgi:Diol dehydratase reactivase ATPase-like domain/DD-reactivating factor swiveling domain
VTVLAGVDVGNATTEVVLMSGGAILGAGRAPTRGRKGSADSLRGAAALVRRVERQAGRQADEARIAPLRAVDTSVVTVPDTAPPRGRLRVLAAGVPTPGGAGACVGPPLLLPAATQPPGDAPLVAVVPSGLRYDEAAARLRALVEAGTQIGAVLVAGDEGVLVVNRLPASLPVIDQVDADAAASCELLAVEVRPPGHAMNLLTDPVALGARLGLSNDEAADAAVLSRELSDYSNAVVGVLPTAPGAATSAEVEPWVVTVDGQRVALRAACPRLAEWPVGTVRVLGTAIGPVKVDDLFAVDLAAAAEAATARQGSTGRAVLVASLGAVPGSATAPPAELLGNLLALPVHSPLSEPAAARLGALTTPGARAGALVVDLGAGTIDVIGADCDVVAAGAGELLTAAVAETLGIPRAAADWVKRGPCVRVDGGQRFEAEDGMRGFLAVSAPASASGMLAVNGPGGLLPFDRRHGPGEWRAIRLRLKLAILARNFQRAVQSLGRDPSQVLVVGGPAGDEELLGVLARSLPDGVAVGRGDVGGDLAAGRGEPLGHRYAVALGLALAGGC